MRDIHEMSLAVTSLLDQASLAIEDLRKTLAERSPELQGSLADDRHRRALAEVRTTINEPNDLGLVRQHFGRVSDRIGAIVTELDAPAVREMQAEDDRVAAEKDAKARDEHVAAEKKVQDEQKRRVEDFEKRKTAEKKTPPAEKTAP